VAVEPEGIEVVGETYSRPRAPHGEKDGLPTAVHTAHLSPEALEVIWDAQLAKLVAYKAEHGDYNVPRRWPKDPGLGNWVSHQRKTKKKLDRGEPSKGMTAARAAKLDACGFTWSSSRSDGQALTPGRMTEPVAPAAEPEEIEVVEETYEGVTYLVCPRTKRIYENGDAGADRGGRARPRPVEGRGGGGGGRARAEPRARPPQGRRSWGGGRRRWRKWRAGGWLRRLCHRTTVIACACLPSVMDIILHSEIAAISCS
jgi:hypothetical protein